jgi:Mg2+/Co2+ transporter CorB
MIWGAIAVLVLVGCSAFFALAETALTAASRPRMHGLESQGDKRAGTVNRLRQHMEQVIGAVLLGNNLVNILASSLATGVLIAFFGRSGVVYATAVMTVLIVVFGELLPKTLAINNADRMALGVAPVMEAIVTALRPIIRAMQFVVRMVLRLFGAHAPADLGAEAAEAELRGAIDLHTDAAADEVSESGAMLHSILDLGALTVADIMVHRSSLVTIDVSLPSEKIVEELLASGFTRVPLWRGEPDNIVGVLHAKHVLSAIHANAGGVKDLDIAGLALAPWFVPDSTTLQAQLSAFRSRREHFALVVDEYGALQGIVTLEDILEEIVGKIEDEHDREVAGVTHDPDGSFRVDGGVTIRDLNRELGWRLPDEEASTVAGLVLHEARRIPEPGQVFVFYGFRFEVLERQRNRIRQVRVTPPPELAKASAA